MTMERKQYPEHKKGGYAEVWHIAYPAVLTMVSQTVMTFVDTMMVGRLGPTELAAVGLSGTLTWGLFSFFNGLVNGVNTFVAQNYGARRFDDIGRVTWQGVYFALVSGVILIFLSRYNVELMRLLGPADDVQRIGSSYLGIRMWGGVFIVLYMCFSAYLRGIGDTRTPLKIVIFINLLNVAGDYVLIFGKLGFPRLGTDGAAYATVGASGVGALIFLLVFLSRKSNEMFSTRSTWRVRLDLMDRLSRVGLPMGLQWLLDMASFIVFSALIGRIGTLELAASTAGLRLMHLSFMPVFGVSIAATTLVGQYIGSEEIPRATRSGYTAIKMSMLYAGLIALLFLIIPRQLVMLINQDPEVVKLGVMILRVAAIFLLFDSMGIAANGSLRGAGDTRWAMIIGVGYAWFIFVPLAYIGAIALKGGAVGAWGGATVYIIALGLTYFLRFRTGKWRSIKI
ncbi:MAG: MATE family efflux transporter [bacterium]